MQHSKLSIVEEMVRGYLIEGQMNRRARFFSGRACYDSVILAAEWVHFTGKIKKLYDCHSWRSLVFARCLLIVKRAMVYVKKRQPTPEDPVEGGSTSL